jgi:hypothetical protein
MERKGVFDQHLFFYFKNYSYICISNTDTMRKIILTSFWVVTILTLALYFIGMLSIALFDTSIIPIIIPLIGNVLQVILLCVLIPLYYKELTKNF